MHDHVASTQPSRREVLKTGGVALALGAAGTAAHLTGATPASAQTPKRGGTLRLSVITDPVGFDPLQTIPFATMVPLSFAYSRLVKIKAGPPVKPMTYPIEPDLAES